MTRVDLLRRGTIGALLLYGLAALRFFSSATFPLSVVSAEEPPQASRDAPPSASIPSSEREGEVPPSELPALPGEPGSEEPLGLQALGPTAPPSAPGLVDRFQQRLALVPPGRLVFNLTVEEEFDDNVFQVGGNRQSDFRTLIVPAIALQKGTGKTWLNLTYTPRILRYTRFPDLDRVDQSLSAAAAWDAAPWLRISVRESLLITEDVAAASPLGISRPGLNRTKRNEVSPGLEFRLTRQSDLALFYTNTVINSEGVAEETTIQSGRVAFRHRLPRGEVSLAYSLTSADLTQGSDFIGHDANLSGSRRLGPNDELLLGLDGALRDQKDGAADSAILSGSVGLGHEFGPRLRSTVIFGVQDFAQGHSRPRLGFFTDSTLRWTHPRGDLVIRAERRFVETFSTVDNVGVINVLRGSTSFSYQLGPRLGLSVVGGLSRIEFEQSSALAPTGERRDLVGTFGIDARYQVLRLLALTAGYQLFIRGSDPAGNDLTTNRVFIGLSIGSSAPLPF